MVQSLIRATCGRCRSSVRGLTAGILRQGVCKIASAQSLLANRAWGMISSRSDLHQSIPADQPLSLLHEHSTNLRGYLYQTGLPLLLRGRSGRLRAGQRAGRAEAIGEGEVAALRGKP